MRLYLISFVALFGLAGCGSSSDIPRLAGQPSQGNFISTTVDVDESYLYTLNPADLTVGGFRIPALEEEGLVLEELAGSPFQLGLRSIVGMVVEERGEFLYLLDASGAIRTYSITAANGQLSLLDEVSTPVRTPRLLRLSNDGESLAVLGERAGLYSLGEDGSLSTPALIENTETWSDLRLNGTLGAASTEAGATGFSWSPGITVEPVNSVVLAGNTRGELTYSGDEVYVVNKQVSSVSHLRQDDDGDLTLSDSFALSDLLREPTLIASLESEGDLIVAAADTLVLLKVSGDGLEMSAESAIDQTPSTLFPLPDSPLVLVGHAGGQGFSVAEYGEDELSVTTDEDPDQVGVSAFGYARRTVRVTQTVGF